MKEIYNILKKYFNDNYNFLDRDTNWTLIINEKATYKILKEKILEFELQQCLFIEKTWELNYKFLGHKYKASKSEETCEEENSNNMSEN